MKILFIHQNFPGQYLHLAQYLRRLGGHEIVGVGEADNIKQRGAIYGITTVGYNTPDPAGAQTHHYLQGTEAAVRRGQTVARALINLKTKGFTPDVISVHPGWGEALFVRDVFPKTPILMFCEYFFEAGQADIQFDPEFPASMDWCFGVRVRNAPQLISLPAADAWISPTKWQASRYPDFISERIQIVHDGIDVNYMRPNPNASVTIQPLHTPGESRIIAPLAPAKSPTVAAGDDSSSSNTDAASPAQLLHNDAKGAPVTLTRANKVITYIARNLEPYRGFHIFLRSLPEIQKQHPDAHILIVGADGTSYSPGLPDGQTYKSKYLAELEGKLDLSHIHFLGRVPYLSLREIFCISTAHVYLTYPFVLSWSVLEAMSCECLLVASQTAPVEEVITHQKDGVLLDFFNRQALTDTLCDVLANPTRYDALRKQARETVKAKFDLESCLKQQVALLQSTVARKSRALS